MKFTLRPWEMSDLDSLVKHANNWNVAKNLTDGFPYPYTKNDGQEFIETASRHQPLRIFAIDVQGEAIGAIGIVPQSDIHRKNMELGYWLAEPFWGKGIMPQAVKQMVDYAFDHFDVDRLFARPFGSNKGSQRVLEKAGFRLEAHFERTLFKNDQYLDELVYGFRKSN